MHHARPDGALAYDDIAFSVRLNSLQRCTVWLGLNLRPEQHGVGRGLPSYHVGPGLVKEKG